MTFPAQSSEKMSLVPVLATLLQFTPKELSAVQRATLLEPAGGGGLWSSLGLGGGGKGPTAMPVFSSSRPAKEVKRPTTTPSVSSSAKAGSSPGAGVSAGVKPSPSSSITGASMSPSTTTTASLVGGKGGVSRTPTVSPAGAAAVGHSANNSGTPPLGTAAAAAIVAASTLNKTAVKPGKYCYFSLFFYKVM